MAAGGLYVGEGGVQGLTTGGVERAALGGGHPEVGRACVEDDLEDLGRGADAHLAIVLGLQRQTTRGSGGGCCRILGLGSWGVTW